MPERNIEKRSPPDRGRFSSKQIVVLLRPWLTLIFVCLLFSLHPVFRSTFWTRSFLPDVLQQSGRNIVLAVGMSFVIMTGGIDLSVGAVLALAGVGMAMALSGRPMVPSWLAYIGVMPIALCALILATSAASSLGKKLSVYVRILLFFAVEIVAGLLIGRLLQNGVKVGFAIGFGVLIGVSCGFLNGLTISSGKVPAFVTTLGMMSIARGLTLYATNSRSVAADYPRLRMLGEGTPLLFVALGVVVLGTLMLRRAKAGRYILAIGGNEQATHLTGVPVATFKTLAYVLSGLCAGIGAVLVTAKFGLASTGAGTGAELEAIAAVVIGGTSLTGGQGSILNALVGALTITVMTSGLVLAGIEANLQQVILGAIIVLTVFLDQIRKREG